MGIRRIKTYDELPLEVGKTYRTKMATGCFFTISRVALNAKDEPIKAYGILSSSTHLGDIPMDPDRLIHDVVETGEIEVCDKCSQPINQKYKK